MVDAREGRSAQTSADLAVIAADTLRRQNAAILGVLLNRVRSTCLAGAPEPGHGVCCIRVTAALGSSRPGGRHVLRQTVHSWGELLQPARALLTKSRAPAQVRQEGRAAEEYREQVAELLGRHGLHLFGAVPRSSLLRSLGCDEIMAALDCQPLLSGEGLDQISTSEVQLAPAVGCPGGACLCLAWQLPPPVHV